jgi:hypothetical protein
LAVQALAGADAVDEHAERALCSFRRVFLAERTGGSVAGVGQRRLARSHQRLVEFGERLGRDEHLAPDLHFGGKTLSR